MLVAVAPDKFAKGLEAGREDVPEVYVVTALDRALTDVYATDAHFVTYVVVGADGRPSERQPRVNKGGLRALRARGLDVRVTCFAADFDNPGHAPHASDEAAIEQAQKLCRARPTAAVYSSRGGEKLIQPYSRWLTPEEAEPVNRLLRSQLVRDGFEPDPKCKDWTRNFRPPHVTRDRVPYRSPFVHALAVPIDPPFAGLDAFEHVDAPLPTIAWSSDVPETLHEIVRVVGAGVRDHVPVGKRHDAFLALCGALLRIGVAPEHLPSVVRGIAELAGTDQRAAVQRARDTARRKIAGRKVTGWSALNKIAPELAVLIDRVAPRAASIDRALPPAPTTPSEDAQSQVQDALRRAPDGLSLIVAPCGLGKTYAAEVVAAERAAKPHATPGPKARAPLHSKTAIAVPTTDLAVQVTGHLRARGVSVARIFSPVRHMTNGKPTCRFVAQARALAAGGQSVRKELCGGAGRNPCQHRNDCAAVDGIDGPDDARVVVGPHQLVGELDAYAGSTGLVILDEPAALIVDTVLDEEKLDLAKEQIPRFDPDFARAIRPVVERARDLLAGGDRPAHVLELDEETRAALEDVKVPPLTAETALDCRVSLIHAKRIGQASATLRALLSAVQARPARVSVEGTKLIVTGVEETLERALRRQGSVVAMGADMDLHRDLYGRAIGYTPLITTVEARLGCEVERVLVEVPASRKRWLDGGKVARDEVIEALELAADVVAERPASFVAIVAFMPVEELLQAGLKGKDRAVERALRRMAERVEVGHFGALRGLDAWKDADVLVTLGDPRPNLGAVRRQAEVLGRPELTDARVEALAAAELEQAHGRLRLVHRTKPARCIHVGRVVPRGWHAPVEVRPWGRKPEDLGALIQAAGGTRAVARALGRDRRNVKRWAAGEYHPDAPTLRALRALAASCSEGGARDLGEDLFLAGAPPLGGGGAVPRPRTREDPRHLEAEAPTSRLRRTVTETEGRTLCT